MENYHNVAVREQRSVAEMRGLVAISARSAENPATSRVGRGMRKTKNSTTDILPSLAGSLGSRNKSRLAISRWTILKKNLKNDFMYMHEADIETKKEALRKYARDIWIKAGFITVALILGQAYLGRIIAGMFGMDISWPIAIVAVIISNISVGLYNGLKIYGKAKRTIEKG